MRFVIDNSVVMRWLFGDGSLGDIEYAERILEILKAEGNVVMAPAIWPLEVGNVIAWPEARNLLKEARSAEFLGILQEMPIEIETQSTERTLTDTLQLARRHNLSTYNASYLELALRDGLPLATNDADLRKALTGTGGMLA